MQPLPYAPFPLQLAKSAPLRVASRIAMATATKKKPVGKVIHFYDRIGVAIIELASPLRVGDTVTFRHGDSETTEAVTSLQIDHAPVEKAKKGDQVGMKVGGEMKEGTVVTKT